MPKVVLVAATALVTGATSFVSSTPQWVVDNSPALIQSAVKPGEFSITSQQVTCVGNLPEVSLGWSASAHARTYLIERQYPWGGAFESVGATSTTSFTDKTYEPGYDLGFFTYRVQAQNRWGKKYSASVHIDMPPCGPGLALQGSTVSSPVVSTVSTSAGKKRKTGTTQAQTQTVTSKPATTTETQTTTPTQSTQPTQTSTTSVVTTQTQTPTPTTPTSPPPSTTQPSQTTGTPAPTTNMQWGTYVDGGASGLKAFETLVGKPVTIQAVFAGWGGADDFPSYLAPSLKGTGKTLLIFWEPSNGDAGQVTGDSENVNQTAYNYDSIINGNWDTYIRSFALKAKAYGDPVILAPFNEMNGDWYPWAGTLNGNTPAKAIAAWRHMHALFADVPNVKFGWAPNSTSWPNIPANDLTAYYPGSAYVDYVGADGFNFNNGSWDTFSMLFNNALVKLEAYNKPIILFSFASAQGTKKADWITDALKVQIPKHPKIVGWVWFHTNKEKDWRVNSDAASLAAFKAALP